MKDAGYSADYRSWDCLEGTWNGVLAQVIPTEFTSMQEYLVPKQSSISKPHCLRVFVKSQNWLTKICWLVALELLKSYLALHHKRLHNQPLTWQKPTQNSTSRIPRFYQYGILAHGWKKRSSHGSLVVSGFRVWAGSMCTFHHGKNIQGVGSRDYRPAWTLVKQ